MGVGPLRVNLAYVQCLEDCSVEEKNRGGIWHTRNWHSSLEPKVLSVHRCPFNTPTNRVIQLKSNRKYQNQRDTQEGNGKEETSVSTRLGLVGPRYDQEVKEWAVDIKTEEVPDRRAYVVDTLKSWTMGRTSRISNSSTFYLSPP